MDNNLLGSSNIGHISHTDNSPEAERLLIMKLKNTKSNHSYISAQSIISPLSLLLFPLLLPPPLTPSLLLLQQNTMTSPPSLVDCGRSGTQYKV